MNTDPQLMYMILILPSLFGLTLIGEGIYKQIYQKSGVMGIFFGFFFMALAVVAYLYFSLNI